MLAAYNRWANARLAIAAFGLPDEAYRRDIGLYFGSVHRTLNHLVLTDRMWMGRIDGSEEIFGPLDLVLHEDRDKLLRDRMATDERLIGLVDSFDIDDFEREYSYRNTSGASFTQPIGQILAHLFNHQTHHRGQAHSGLSLLGAAPPALDLLMFQRGAPTPDLGVLLTGA